MQMEATPYRNLAIPNHHYEIRSSASSKFISALFATLEDEGIKYCILRNYENLPHDYGNDIDILTAPEGYKIFNRLLLMVAQRNGWACIGQTDYLGYHKLYFSSLRAEECLLRIDIQTGSERKGIPTYSVNYVLEKRVRRQDFYVASKGTEAAITLTKNLMRYGKIETKNNARVRIRSCANTKGDDFVDCLSPCFGQRIAEWLLHRAREGSWESIEQRYQMLRWAVTWRAFAHNHPGQVLRWVRFFWGHLRHRVKRPLGFFVVLLGSDGSGKTTIAEGLAGFWKSNFSKEVVHIHGDFKLLPRLRNLRKLWARIHRKPMKPDVDFTKKHSGALVKPHSLIRSLCYICYYMWDYVLGHFVVFFHKGSDSLIVSDRYFYEYFYQLGNSNLPHWLLHLVKRAIPEPDLIVCLERDPKSIYEGKNELTIAEIERQQTILRKLIDNIPCAVLVNGNEGIEATVQEIQRHILIAMSKRTR